MNPLPTGLTEFHEWSDRIIAGSGLTATHESQKFALANILIGLPHTTAFEDDSYFINCLRKTAVNQVAEFVRQEVRDAAKARLEKQKQAEATAPESADASMAENQRV